MDNPIFKNEKAHLNGVVVKIQTAIQKAEKDAKTAEKDTNAIHKNFSNDVRINTANYSELLETAASVRQQQQLLAERENSWQHATKQLDVLTKLEKKPYFARIDIHENGEKNDETIYIGMSSFSDSPDHFLVYDWRAPISSVYYDGKMGNVEYATPDGTQQVDLKSKRQFVIEDSKLISVYDTDETIGDQMLLDALGNQSDIKMKSIVSTIQREQNKIIRNTSADLLFVQGAAGSGKTAAILQRVAFLLYRYRGKLTAGQVLMFSPNQLFNDYVDQVLPELGEQNMVQMTYFQFSRRRLPNLDIESLQERFEREVTPAQKNIQDFEGSLQFFNAVTSYATHLNQNGMRFRNIMYQGKPIFKKEKIRDIYYSFSSTYNLGNRLDGTREALVKMLNQRVGSELRSNWVEDAVQELSQEEVRTILQKADHEFKDNDEEFKFLARQLVMKELKPVRDAIVRNRFFSINAQYVQMLRAIPKIVSLENIGITQEEWDSHVESVVNDIRNHHISLLDTSAYLYLYDQMVGKRGDRSMRYVFIDEIQDYNAFQLAYIRYNFPRAKFTLLGDLNQSIFTGETTHSLLNELSTMFNPEKTEVIQLTQSYRSTQQITDFTKELLTEGESIDSFSRNGELPKVVLSSTQQQMVQSVVDQLQRDEQDNETTAIIGRSTAECEEIADLLKAAGQKVTLIKSENQRLVEGTIIVPSFLAKGLEFDSVVVWNASEKEYGENDQQLLYTICSRAMHRLLVVTDGQISPLIAKVPQNLYEFFQNK
ncbi:RNA polymerase recycling motor HelD [Pediococcus claussenii]|uniref:RNA polymerase recycling motor HelD n=1 Tax=Pediococcus claussenii TaxID=187452 RepID=UPI0002F69969|nr:RNA polymerase recycling motor HelD [Pediococcus claussenii]ANZ69107.1 ATP-dependent DNA helicase [Pediococcus claussenii]ANZ70924.1 ATP-dependent DNA helicase [Pediococcus claussenii]